MGSWNTTCAISNLPIHENEEVYGLMLAENPFPIEDFCYSTTYCSPVGFLFEGKYDDYGRMKTKPHVLHDDNIEMLKNNLFEMYVGENEYHDIAITKDLMNSEFLWEANHEDRLFIKGYDINTEKSGI